MKLWISAGVDADGDSDRYQQSVYVSIQRERAHCAKLGGTAEVSDFCPLTGIKVFFVIKKGV